MTYYVKGRYKDFDWELIDTAADRDEGEYLLREYMMSYGRDWELILDPDTYWEDDDELDRMEYDKEV